MATLYRVHALETDTRIERFDMATPTRTAAESRAELWASRYDGKNGATWCKRCGSDYIVGRLYPEGFRGSGTCLISIDEVDEDDFGRSVGQPGNAHTWPAPRLLRSRVHTVEHRA